VKYLIDTNVISEIRKGIQLARRRSAERARTLELWLSDLRRAFDDRLLDVDRDIAEEWGQMSGLRNVATIDGLLAATAKVRRMTLVTRNSGDVEGLGADVFNPFDLAR
jgi:predicted nucleic acid-binding protein